MTDKLHSDAETAQTAAHHIVQSQLNFTRSDNYWDERYRQNGHSGAGSYGRLAEFKAEVINRFAQQQAIQSVIEFGSGDGNQLSLANYPDYTGFDVSTVAIAHCQKLFAHDGSKKFIHTSQYAGQKADLTLSLDVIYHLVEDEVFDEYMRRLFGSAQRFVMIYSSNDEVFNAAKAAHVKHVRHRKFTDWIVENIADSWQLFDVIGNRFPFDARDSDNTSFADFYIFERIAG
ncbi:class I SAM-dependent methyltransferase [Cedecea davisae]|uniref:Class I SAM-dependent methyltransferase n=1 Tax=Cedecea davisae TaxID=158484 RepID=A0ABS6DMP0_9ENTR|nr:class I SAM-dependent methyltransferase [Cedecea davisae]MBU4684489.1 class I SAM-dependent methyltransferase [Cedecea davisae]MBU4688665.1 class I SAM-dependent methyltransferase [Cedecea davisae]